MQNRDAPAYQEFAASVMAKLAYRKMTLPERGLLYTMRLECWVNSRLPREPEDLAKVLGIPVGDVDSALPSVMAFFDVDGDFIYCPELEDYRKHLADRKEKQSNGGKKAAAITNSKRNRTQPNAEGVDVSPSSNSRVPRRGMGESSVQSSTVKPSQNQSSVKGGVC